MISDIVTSFDDGELEGGFPGHYGHNFPLCADIKLAELLVLGLMIDIHIAYGSRL